MHVILHTYEAVSCCLEMELEKDLERAWVTETGSRRTKKEGDSCKWHFFVSQKMYFSSLALFPPSPPHTYSCVWGHEYVCGCEGRKGCQGDSFFPSYFGLLGFFFFSFHSWECQVSFYYYSFFLQPKDRYAIILGFSCTVFSGLKLK